MESHFDPSEDLQAVDEARRALADRLVTPWWLYPTMGVLTGQLIVGLGLGNPWTAFSAILFAIGIIVIVAATRNTTGVYVSKPTGPRSTRALRVFTVGLVFAITIPALYGETWFSWVSGVAALLAIATLGPRFNEAQRKDLRSSS